MQASSTGAPSPIDLPAIDSDEPVTPVPLASVAPLDGAPDGERITTFALAPKRRGRTGVDSVDGALEALQDHARDKPFRSLLAAFAVGYLAARVLR